MSKGCTSSLSAHPQVSLPYHDPDHLVLKLKFEAFSKFQEVVVSHLTKYLDLNDHKLQDLISCETTTSNKKLFYKRKGLLKKKILQDVLTLDDDVLGQMQQLIDFISSDLSPEGLFRKPGNTHRMEQIKKGLKIGLKIDFASSGFHCHDAASVLKNYLGHLCEPLLLLPGHLECHMQISGLMKTMPDGSFMPNKERRIECLQLLLLLLPTTSKQLLQAILNLLYRTAKAQAQNKMTSANLSAMFAPHLIWPRSAGAKQLHEDYGKLNDHVAFMIRHSQKIFSAPQYLRNVAAAYFNVTDPMTTPNKKVRKRSSSITELVCPSSAVKPKVSTPNITDSCVGTLIDNIVNDTPVNHKKRERQRLMSKQNKLSKYRNPESGKPRKRTLSGMLRMKSKPRKQSTSSENANNEFFDGNYWRADSPGKDWDTLQYRSTESNLDGSVFETKSLNAMVLRSTTNAFSFTSLPGAVRQKCNSTVLSPNLLRVSLKRKMSKKVKRTSCSKSLDDLLCSTKENDAPMLCSTPVPAEKSSIKMTAV